MLLQPPKARFEWFSAANKQTHKDLEILVWLFKECPTLNPKIAIAGFKPCKNVLLEAAKARFDLVLAAETYLKGIQGSLCGCLSKASPKP